jgi:hypothetical protein
MPAMNGGLPRDPGGAMPLISSRLAEDAIDDSSYGHADPSLRPGRSRSGDRQRGRCNVRAVIRPTDRIQPTDRIRRTDRIRPNDRLDRLDHLRRCGRRRGRPRWDRGNTAEMRPCRFGVDAGGVVAGGDEQDGGGVGADAVDGDRRSPGPEAPVQVPGVTDPARWPRLERLGPRLPRRGRAVPGDDLGHGRPEGYVPTPTPLRDR